jgi:hypothetical protein
MYFFFVQDESRHQTRTVFATCISILSLCYSIQVKGKPTAMVLIATSGKRSKARVHVACSEQDTAIGKAAQLIATAISGSWEIVVPKVEQLRDCKAKETKKDVHDRLKKTINMNLELWRSPPAISEGQGGEKELKAPPKFALKNLEVDTNDTQAFGYFDHTKMSPLDASLSYNMLVNAQTSSNAGQLCGEAGKSVGRASVTICTVILEKQWDEWVEVADDDE